MTLKFLHDHHIARLAWRARRSRIMTDPAMGMFGLRTVSEEIEQLVINKPLENWMKLVKTSAIAVAISALLAGPVLAQGASSGTQSRGGAQGKTQMQGGASGSVDEDAPAGAASQRAGAKTGMKGTVGAGSGAPQGTAKPMGGAATPPATSR
jgi:hypothetical protein